MLGIQRSGQALFDFLLDLLQIRRQHHVLRVDGPLDAQVLLERLLVSVLCFETLPLFPHSSAVVPWVCELTDVNIDGPRSLDFSHFDFDICVLPPDL